MSQYGHSILRVDPHVEILPCNSLSCHACPVHSAVMSVQLDKERSNYGLKEANLVRFLIRACVLDPKTSTAAQRAENWRQAGVKNAGQFSKVMEEV